MSTIGKATCPKCGCWFFTVYFDAKFRIQEIYCSSCEEGWAPKGRGEERNVRGREAVAGNGHEPADLVRASEGGGGILAAYKVGRPLIGDRHKILAALRPWDALGMSQRTWQRRRKAARDAAKAEELEEGNHV